MKKNQKKRKRRKLNRLLMNSNFRINRNLFGWEKLKMSLRKNMPTSIRVYLMIGKIIWKSNCSLLKDNSNSKLFCLSQKELHSICSKLRRRITSNCMSEEFSLWMIVKNWSLNISGSLKELLIVKIFHWIFQENSCNRTESLRWSRRTSSRNHWKCSTKLLKMLKTIRSSMNNLERTSS